MNGIGEVLTTEEVIRQMRGLPREVLVDAMFGYAKDQLLESGIPCTSDSIRALGAAHLAAFDATGHLADIDQVFAISQVA